MGPNDLGQENTSIGSKNPIRGFVSTEEAGTEPLQIQEDTSTAKHFSGFILKLKNFGIKILVTHPILIEIMTLKIYCSYACFRIFVSRI